MDSSPVWMLGKKHECEESPEDDKCISISQKKHTFPSFVLDFNSRIWCTYRKDFDIIPGSYYTSDMGWGCMHRTAQMTLAQAFLNHYLGRDWRKDNGYELPRRYYEILQWFSDTLEAPYSVHNISIVGALQNKAVGQWYGPSTVAYALKELVSRYHGDQFAVYVSNNGIIYSDEVKELCGGQEWTKSLILLVPVRLGVETVPENYYKLITSLFQYPQSLGLAGGKPKSSLYFLGVQGDSLFYLDPHVIFNTVDMTKIPFDVSSYQPQEINNIKISHIDPSFSAAFYIRDYDEYLNFCEITEKVIDKNIHSCTNNTNNNNNGYIIFYST